MDPRPGLSKRLSAADLLRVAPGCPTRWTASHNGAWMPRFSQIVLASLLVAAAAHCAHASVRFDAPALAHWVGHTPNEFDPTPRYALGNLDGDHIPDLVTTGHHDSLFVFLGA